MAFERLQYELQRCIGHKLPFAVDTQVVARVVQGDQLLIGRRGADPLIGQSGAVGVDRAVERAVDDQQGAGDLRQQPLYLTAAA